MQHSAFGRALETGRAWRGSASLFAPTRKKLKKNQSFVWSKVDLCMIGRSLLFVFHNAKLTCAADVCNRPLAFNVASSFRRFHPRQRLLPFGNHLLVVHEVRPP
ncbi:hypothetical protein, partial [Agrobacterium tumefaciens]|uniref:hypothetical protein n=1 Tax=Agrobacterium tumefaciens TaxID=358 RepID=UPI001AEDA78A